MLSRVGCGSAAESLGSIESLQLQFQIVHTGILQLMGQFVVLYVVSSVKGDLQHSCANPYSHRNR